MGTNDTTSGEASDDRLGRSLQVDERRTRASKFSFFRASLVKNRVTGPCNKRDTDAMMQH